jgi:uncharacterized membrane protein YgdD (TMEM256/DUF423 family)
MPRFFSVLGCCYGFLWVALGALAAHAVRLDPAALLRFEQAQRTLIVHALVLIVLGHQQSLRHLPLRWLAGCCFSVGSALFCGSVFALSLGWITKASFAPAGGVLLMLGWFLWGVALLKKPK